MLGSLIHGGYDLANAINPPVSTIPVLSSLPSQIDPRGLLSFGLFGTGVLVTSWLMTRSGQFPRGLGYVGLLFGALLVITYLGRLIIPTPTSPVILAPSALEGLVVGPIRNFWLGFALFQKAGK